MTTKKPVTVHRWSYSERDEVSLSVDIEAEPDHVKVALRDLGYDESSRLGLDWGHPPAKMRRLAVALRTLADTIDAACTMAEVPK